MRPPGYLIAVLVLAVVALGGWFLLLRPGPAEPPREAPVATEVGPVEPEPELETGQEPRPVSEPPAAQSPAETDLETIECRLDVERWDSGDREAVERKYGDSAEAVVEGCRAIPPPATD